MSAAVTWFQKSFGVDVTGDWARHIHLNVGGVLYTTRRHTLRHLHEHPLFGPILSGRGHKCEDGSFLFDGDGALFRYILGFFRTGSLTVPDNFNEWEMLLQEVRHYQLPELEQLVLDRFEYQRCVFKRQLPHGVYVWWPPLMGQRAVSPPASSTAPPPPPQPLTSSSQGGVSVRNAGTEKVTATRTTALPPSPASSSAPPPPPPPQVHFMDTSYPVRIVPPLPGLTVKARTSGTSVTFRETQVLQDLDQLVTVLLSAYGYSIQHWDEARGRVLLTLPGAL